jgi:hypothetical protein
LISESGSSVNKISFVSEVEILIFPILIIPFDCYIALCAHISVFLRMNDSYPDNLFLRIKMTEIIFCPIKRAVLCITKVKLSL